MRVSNPAPKPALDIAHSSASNRRGHPVAFAATTVPNSQPESPPISGPRLGAALKALHRLKAPQNIQSVRFKGLEETGMPVLIAPGFMGEYLAAKQREGVVGSPMSSYLPSVRESTGNGRVIMMDMISRDFESNIVHVTGPVTSAMADALKMQFKYIANKLMDDNGVIDRKKALENPVKLIINSPGGEVLAMEQILDAMDELKNSGVPIHTYVGFAASAATLIASNGTPNHRFISPRGRFMIHQPLGGSGGQQTDIAIRYRLITQMKEQLINHLYEKSYGKRTREEIAQDVERDHWMQGREAVKYGLLDDVNEKFPTAVAPEDIPQVPDGGKLVKAPPVRTVVAMPKPDGLDPDGKPGFDPSSLPKSFLDSIKAEIIKSLTEQQAGSVEEGGKAKRSRKKETPPPEPPAEGTAPSGDGV